MPLFAEYGPVELYEWSLVMLADDAIRLRGNPAPSVPAVPVSGSIAALAAEYITLAKTSNPEEEADAVFYRMSHLEKQIAQTPARRIADAHGKARLAAWFEQEGLRAAGDEPTAQLARSLVDDLARMMGAAT